MKRIISLALVATLSLTVFAGCGGSKTTSNDIYKVGMATDAGPIDDKSFNQGAWEGILKYQNDKKTIESKYIKPAGEAKADYISAIQDLTDSGYQLIVTPGFKFSSAINDAQNDHPDTKFVLIDAAPSDDEGNPSEIKPNTLSIFFTENEPGFYAGVVSALGSKTGKVGFIGGMEIPAVQKYGWGFVAGVAYANKNYNTNVEVAQYKYQGTFSDVAAGKTLAASYYDQGIDIIFSAAGGVGVGVIEEGKTRKIAGEDVWVVGVDKDQFLDGMYNDKDSCILTSAQKNITEATYRAIDDAVNDKFQGGKSEILSSKEDAVGLPENNPNMSNDQTSKYKEVLKAVKDGKIVVPNNKEDLTKFLDDAGYTTPSTVIY